MTQNSRESCACVPPEPEGVQYMCDIVAPSDPRGNKPNRIWIEWTNTGTKSSIHEHDLGTGELRFHESGQYYLFRWSVS